MGQLATGSLVTLLGESYREHYRLLWCAAAAQRGGGVAKGKLLTGSTRVGPGWRTQPLSITMVGLGTRGERPIQRHCRICHLSTGGGYMDMVVDINLEKPLKSACGDSRINRRIQIDWTR